MGIGRNNSSNVDINMTLKNVVVITGGLNGLGAVRSLNQAGFTTIVIYSSKNDLAAISRIPKKKIFISNDDQWEFNLLTLLKELDFESSPAIIACTDQAANFLSANHSILSNKYKQLSPNAKVTNILNDKKLEIEIMRNSSIPIPNSVTSISEIVENGLLTSLQFPIIIKPRSYKESVLLDEKNFILKDLQDWQEFYFQYKSGLDQFIAQEVIEGDDDCLWVCNTTFDENSNLLSAFTFQRLGTSPSHFGVTSLAISKANKEIKNICKTIGKSLSYTGSAMFEFKFKQSTNEYIYIETNPRIGMCNWFDTCCGVNNVAINCSTALALPIMAPSKQKDNVLFFHFYGDFIARLKNSEKITHILKLYLRHIFKDKVWAVFWFRDPYPFLIHFSKKTSYLFNSFFRKLFKK